MRKLLRGIYYFCAGIKSACIELVEWYTTNKSVPRFLRNRASLLVIVLAIIAGGWGLVAAITGAEGERRELPVSQNSAEDTPSQADKSSSSEPASSQSSSEQSSSDAASSEPFDIDALASATRFAPITAEQLTTALAERVKKYYADATANGVIFTPPAAGDINAWKTVNPDVMGWITIANTNINYPVVKGAYTDYYTYRGYYKESSRNGVIWVDSDTQLAANGAITSQNTVLYGHNWTNCWRPVRIGNPNDIMFAQLHAYDDAAFAAANPYIRLATAEGDHLYQIFTVFYARPTEFAYNYADGARVPGIITKAKSMSIHPFNVPVSTSDKIITLSTCTRVMGAGDNQRFVVMAKKIS